MSVQIGNINLGDFPLLLAPMEDVSDPPFRYVCKQNGADMMYTEFISRSEEHTSELQSP